MRPHATVDLLERLISFRSVFTAADYSDVADFVIGYLRELGFACHRVTGATPGRAGVFASLGPSGPGGVMLSAHLDVVPVDGQDWATDPFRLTRRGGRLYGRGTTDMKGFAAAALAAAGRAVRRKLAAPLKLAFSYDEEAGCVGIAEMIGSLDRTIGLPEFCIVGEPTSMRVAVGHKGKLSFTARCRGSAGHSAAAPDHLNALHLAADLVNILRREQAEIVRIGPRDGAYDIPYTTVHVGTLVGGTALNIVPDTAVLEFEIRHLAGDLPEPLVERIGRDAAALVANQRERHPQAAVEISQFNAYPGLETLPGSRMAVLALRLGGLGPPTKVSYGTEAGFFQQTLRIPTVVCGPGDMVQGHKPDEFIEAEQLAACDAMLDRLLHYLS